MKSSKKQMSFLFICNYLKSGGIERQMLELADALQQDNYHVEILLIHNIIHFDIKDKYNIQALHSKGIRKYIEAIKKTGKIKFDIIHSWGPVPSPYAILISLFSRKLLISGYVRNSYDVKLLSKDWIRFLFVKMFSKKIVGNNKIGLSKYKTGKKGVYIPNGFNFNRIENLKEPAEIRNELGIKTTHVVTMVASFARDGKQKIKLKDWDTFINVAIECIDSIEDITFLGIGTGPALNFFSQKVPAKYKNKIIFPGKRNDIESIINISKVCLMLSKFEGLSNAIMEYMALEKPVITTSEGGTVELIKDEINGFYCKDKDVKNITKKIIYLLNNQIKRDQMGNEGKKILENHFDIKFMINNYIRLYKILKD